METSVSISNNSGHTLGSMPAPASSPCMIENDAVVYDHAADAHNIVKCLSNFNKEVMKGEYCYVEMTINHPRTKTFLTLNSELQRRLYGRILSKIPNLINQIDVYAKSYEHCKDGQIHLHCILRIPNTVRYHVMGLLSDICKSVCNSPTIRQTFQSSKVYHEYQRIRQNCVLTQFRHYACQEDMDRVQEFFKYMHKENI